MNSKAWAAALASGLVMLAGAACDEDGGGDGGLGGATAPTFGSSDCGVCVHDACASEVAACGADPECAAYVTCVDGCPIAADGNVDPGCEQGCPRGSGTAAADAIRLLTICRTTGPGALCQGCGQGGAGGGSGILNQQCDPSNDPNPCAQCELSHCCETHATYLESPEAQAYLACVQECLDVTPTSDCYFECYEQHPEGIEAFAPRLACTMIYCHAPDACGVATDPCMDCVTANCAEPWVALYSDPAGFLLFECTVPCGEDPACYDACLAQYPSARPMWEAWTACFTSSCPAECG